MSVVEVGDGIVAWVEDSPRFGCPNSAAIVEHDCRLGAFCHIAPGAVLTGDVRVGEDTLIGAGAVVCPGLRIGRRVTLAAGAAATADLPDQARAAGVPARPLVAPAAQVTG